MIIKNLVIGTAAGIVLAGGAYAADLNSPDGAEVARVLRVQPVQSLSLSARCALASARIRDNNCKPIDCDRGLGMALRAGCHINHWGHTPR